MRDFWARLFDSSDFPARWHCGAWTSGHGWLHILSDLGVWSAYFVIPCVLGYYALRVRGLPFRGILLLFVAFILSCGVTHLMEAVIFWWPAYRLAGLLKLLTAVISWVTVFALVQVTPEVLSLRSPAELEAEIAERKLTEEALRASEARFRIAVEATGMGVWDTTSPRGVLGWDAKLKALWGLPSDAVVTWESMSAMIHPDDRAEVLKAALPALEPNVAGSFHVEHRIRTPQGEERWVSAWGRTMFAPSERERRPVRSIGVMLDVTDRKRAEERLTEREETYRTMIEDQTEVVCRLRADGTFLFVNNVYCRTFGKTSGELIGATWTPVAHPEDVPDIQARLATLSADHPIVRIENRVFDGAGRTRWMEFVNRGFFGPDGNLNEIQAVGRDVTDRREIEEKLRRSLEEKETLLKEIHHRVKNNLQIVSTLLDLQSDHTQDRQALEMFRESRSRVKSMALVHERLYRSDDLARVHFGEYVRQLAEDLYHAYHVSSDRISLETDVDVPPLPIDIAIPCGLLLNELMSNCLKHAFRDASAGHVRVALRRGVDGIDVLSVADDGVGFPDGLDLRNPSTFGLQLVITLVQQLKGTIEVKSDRGTEIIVTFPDRR